MSSVILQVGQCGNQIGQNFWKTAARDECSGKCHVYCRPDGKLRSVHVDSEPKVVQKLLRNPKISESNVIFGKRGRGTNWALGYNGVPSKGDNHLIEDTMEALRREIERCDRFSGTILFHSLSGGTGSGVGSRLCEAIRDDFPMQYLLSCTVAPCASGESPLQHYNSVLTLAWLHRYTDGVVLLHNDDMLRRAMKRREEESVSFEDINSAISACLGGVLLPTDTLKSSGYSLGQEPWEMIRSLCPMPSLKFLQLYHVSRSKLSWDGLVGSLLQTVRRHDTSGKSIRTLSSLLVARGDSTDSFHRSMNTMDGKIRSTLNSVHWNPFPLDYWTARSNYLGPRGSATLTMAGNSGAVVEFLDTVSNKAQLMYQEKAYLHWYWKYGASQETFSEAFETLSAIQEDYIQAIR